MSYANARVAGMSVGYLFSGLLGHLPLLAVLIAGFVLIATRRRWLGARSVLLARLGLGALALASVLQLAWSMLIPTLYSRLDYSTTRYTLLFSLSGLVTALISAAGVALLIAAVVTRGNGPTFGGQPPPGGDPYGGQPPTAEPSYGGQPPRGGSHVPGQGPAAGPLHGDRPSGPPWTG